MERAIQEAIAEFAPLYDEVTTSDLQGLCMARAMKILGNNKSEDVISVMNISGRILEGIYAIEERRESE